MSKSGKTSLRRLAARQDNRCFYCGCHMTRLESDAQMTRDHRIPSSRLADFHPNDVHHNIVAACRACNSAKGNLTDMEFLAISIDPVTRRQNATAARIRRNAEHGPWLDEKTVAERYESRLGDKYPELRKLMGFDDDTGEDEPDQHDARNEVSRKEGADQS